MYLLDFINELKQYLKYSPNERVYIWDSKEKAYVRAKIVRTIPGRIIIEPYSDYEWDNPR